MWENLLYGENESFLRFLLSQSYEVSVISVLWDSGNWGHTASRERTPGGHVSACTRALMLSFWAEAGGKLANAGESPSNTHIPDDDPLLLTLVSQTLPGIKGINYLWSSRPAQSKNPTRNSDWVRCLFGELLGLPWSIVLLFLQAEAWTIGQSPAAWSLGINNHRPN